MARRGTGGPVGGFHEGEIAIQQRAGVRAEAQHLVRMLDPVELSAGVAKFLAQGTLIVMSARDRGGTLWTSPLVGPRGFVKVTGPRALHIWTTPVREDPLYGLPAGQKIGLVTMDFAKRRRFRLNGYLTDAGRRGLNVEVEQAYGNCPQYIQQRILTPAEPSLSHDPSSQERERRVSTRLSEEDIAQIRCADTFFLGTTHPTRGNDANHRGGPAGFVRVEDSQFLWWPDYLGNNMFNSLGNLAVDPTTALLFVDFTTGRTLHLSGRAVVEATAPGVAGDDGHTDRRVRFRLDTATLGAQLLQRAAQTIPYPRNPPITA